MLTGRKLLSILEVWCREAETKFSRGEMYKMSLAEFRSEKREPVTENEHLTPPSPPPAPGWLWLGDWLVKRGNAAPRAIDNTKTNEGRQQVAGMAAVCSGTSA